MDSLLSAKSDFASLGSSLASIQQNAVDDQISNNASVQNYKNVSAQLKASIPSSFGELAFGAYEFGGQAKTLLTRIGNAIEGVKAAPDAIKAALVKGGNQLGARGNELTALASETTGKIQETANTLKTNLGASVEELKTVASGAVGDLQTAAQTAATSGKAALETAATSGRTALETAATSRLTPLTQTAITVPEIAVPELPRFSLPLASKRPTVAGLADTMAPENIRQTGLRAIDPEEMMGPIFSENLRS